MAQNNLAHYSDLARYKIFEPVGTQWPTTVKDVQSALAMIGPWARTDQGLPLASNTVKGIAKLATQAEVDAGDSTDTIVTPATLKVRLANPQASETVLGLTRYATQAETAAFTINNKAIVPSQLGYVFNNITATQTRFGTAKLTTPAQAQAGTDQTSVTSPARVKEMIAFFSPVAPTYTPATETNLGLVQLATTGQIAQGTIREGFAISPYGFMNTRATESSVGTIRIANSGEANAGTSGDTALSPRGLMGVKGSIGKFGIVKLSNNPDGDPTTALASTAPVVYTSRRINGYSLANDFNITSNDVNCYNRQESDGRYLFKWDQQAATWCRNWATQQSPGNWWALDTGAPSGGAKAVLDMSVKFERNYDDQTNRVFQFDIRVNGQTVITDVINIFNTKGGSRGHSWRFEAFGTKYYEFNIPAGANIQIVPTNIYLVQSYSARLSVNN